MLLLINYNNYYCCIIVKNNLNNKTYFYIVFDNMDTKFFYKYNTFLHSDIVYDILNISNLNPLLNLFHKIYNPLIFSSYSLFLAQIKMYKTIIKKPKIKTALIKILLIRIILSCFVIGIQSRTK